MTVGKDVLLNVSALELKLTVQSHGLRANPPPPPPPPPRHRVTCEIKHFIL